ncbi:MAG: calcium/sodium antiporter [Bacteroidales bacterium]|nr:calcium/sodium antiporter [Bacteroidales bacterium]
MFLACVLLLTGLALVVFGADYLVEGASAVARRFGLSEFVIGLTIVGMGTSAPEMVVSFIGASEGNADIALGNVVGSNIFNTLLILGLTAVMLPIGITESNRKRDIPVNIFITVLLILLGLEATLFGVGTNGLSRWDGAIMIGFFILYFLLSFKQKAPQEGPADEVKQRNIWLSVLFILGGLAALIFGGQLFVNSATSIAKALHVSDKFIAITVLAGGTSLPELATCVAAAVKKKGQLALGNIIGSNVFNILLILGGSALIHPLSFDSITYVDLTALLVSALALLTSSYVGKKNCIDRLDGALFLLLWAGYFTYLFTQL